MKNDQEDAFDRVLVTTLARVIDFLKFAEAKNAALLTFSSALTLAAVNGINSNTTGSQWKTAFILAMPLCVTAALLAIFSFLPKVRLDRFNKDPSQDKSLLYFGDAATFAPAAYKQRVWERYMPPEGTSATQAYLDDLAIQIAVNSHITTRKLKIFNIGAFLVFTAVMIIGTPGIMTAYTLIRSFFWSSPCP